MDEFGDIKSKINYRDIKSSYIIKKVFSFLKDNLKLNMIICCKELQNICSLDIKDYKKISGKYKIDGINGKGKEYNVNTNQIIFEGEYLNGKRNGNGKEYLINTNQIIFEGEYLNGKRNGIGKEYYNYNGNIKYKGEKKWERKRIFFKQ